LKRLECSIAALRWMRLFPGIRAGASLKLQHMQIDGLRSFLFPGIRAGASLKRGDEAVTMYAAADLFPGIRAGASLKQDSLRRRHGVTHALFPGIRAGASLKLSVGAKRERRQPERSSPAFVPGPH